MHHPCRAKPISVETYLENKFVPTIDDLEKAVTPATKAILLGYPNNRPALS
jgi:aspartate/methionine/tyrosine aminotransferase